MDSALQSFSPPVREWFEQNFGWPTPPQEQGWPAIQRGEHTLILAPTGSGKTLTAFLWGIDQLLRELAEQPPAADGSSRRISGSRGRKGGQVPPAAIRLVYVSPLKALNNDISRNLRAPLAGIKKLAAAAGHELPEVRVAVRSGDTPSAERQRILRSPPHILITTPESLYLLLTSPRARAMFSSVRTVIVDEIHTMAGSKRGAHLAVSLERLEHLAESPVQRIGLSATIRPLAEVARFLGGAYLAEDGATELRPRLVTIVDAAYRKDLDLRVESLFEDFPDLPGGSVWPLVIPRVLELIREHRTTLVFVNNRRLAERTADRLNEQLAAEAGGRESALVVDGVAVGSGFTAIGRGRLATREGIEPIRAHHGSMAREARLEMEQGLKEGRLRALVGTASLELGIDIGSIDLVVQLQSPKSVAQGLQRVGRSGHLVGQTSKGRIFPTHREDLVEAAVVARGMLQGEVEELSTPVNALDVLAQQLVAMVSVEDWEVEQAYRLVRQAYPFRDLTQRAFRSVLEMLSGRYPSEVHRELRPRISWDRVNDRLSALPGARLLALTNGGTIPDRGLYGAYLPDGRTRLGELDEEFVFETRPGDTFMLGSQVWRVLEVTEERVVVKEAPGALARMPFWHGDYPWRPYELGRRVGCFRGQMAARVRGLAEQLGLDNPGDLQLVLDPEAEAELPPALKDEIDRLEAEHALNPAGARGILAYTAAMLDRGGALSSDREIIVETFFDAVGDPRIVVHSPFGGRVNGPWGLALADALKERTGIEVEVQSSDDGILLRLPDAEGDLPLEIVEHLTPREARERILRTLPDSAVFGAQFRMNAARALLLPGNRPGHRTPFWLQRLRAKDLLQAVRRYPDFPLLAETFRDCLEDVMDLPDLEKVLAGIQSGEIKVTRVESALPSPVAQSLLWNFTNIYLYEQETPKAERQLQTLTVNRELLGDLLRNVALDELLRPEALQEIEGRLSRTAPGRRARTREELAVILLNLGDLSEEEIAQRVEGADAPVWLNELAAAGRLARVGSRWVPVELLSEYETALSGAASPPEEPAPPTGAAGAGRPGTQEVEAARRAVLLRYLSHSGPVTAAAVSQRYGFAPDWVTRELERLVGERRLVHGRFRPRDLEAAGPASGVQVADGDEYVDAGVLEQIHRRTLGILRHEVRPVALPAYADFLARWQHLGPAERLRGAGGLRQVLQQLRAAPVSAALWERDVLPLRLERYDPAEFEALFEHGELVWVASGGGDLRRARVRLLFRGEGRLFLEPSPEPEGLSSPARELLSLLRDEGALFFADAREALALPEVEVKAVLAELALRGYVTSDSLAALRDLIESPRPVAPAGKGPRSSLEEDLARRLAELPEQTGRHHRGRPSYRSAYRAAGRRYRQRMRAERPPDRGVRAGRWSLVHRFGVLGKESPSEEVAVRQARLLLTRYGVVSRLSLEREEGSWNWAGIYRELQRLEMRGEVRRGYFVAGLPGAQFALPEAVERLREGAASSARSTSGTEPILEELVVMNAADPANIWAGGLGAPVLGFARIPSTWVVIEAGLPLLVAEDTGTRIRTRRGCEDYLLREGLRMLLGHLGSFQHRVRVETWDGVPVAESPAVLLLESLGFYTDQPGMTWERAVSPGPGNGRVWDDRGSR